MTITASEARRLARRVTAKQHRVDAEVAYREKRNVKKYARQDWKAIQEMIRADAAIGLSDMYVEAAYLSASNTTSSFVRLFDSKSDICILWQDEIYKLAGAADFRVEPTLTNWQLRISWA